MGPIKIVTIQADKIWMSHRCIDVVKELRANASFLHHINMEANFSPSPRWY